MYSHREPSSLAKRYVGDCQTREDVTRRGSREVSGGIFLSTISRVVSNILSVFWRIFIVKICSHGGISEVFGLHGELLEGITSKSAVISHVS